MFFLRPTAATGAEKLPKTCLMLTLYIQSQCSGWTEFFKSIKSSQTERQPQPHWLDIILWLDLITFRVLHPARWLYIMIWLWLYGWTKWLYLRPASVEPCQNTTRQFAFQPARSLTDCDRPSRRRALLPCLLSLAVG